MDASRYFPLSKYRSPLSRYFCLRTLGSREHPKKNVAVRARLKIKRKSEECFIPYLPIQVHRRRSVFTSTSHRTKVTQLKNQKKLLPSLPMSQISFRRTIPQR